MISARVAPPLPHSMRKWMIAIVLFAVMPMLAFALLVGRTLVEQQRAELHADLQNASDVAARELAREVRLMFATLDTLAASEAALRADFAALHAQASRVVAHVPRIGSIAGVDLNGVRRFSTLTPFAVTLPPSALAEFDQRVIRTGDKQISALVTGSISGKKSISFAVPVKQGDKVVMVLRLTMWSDAIGEVIYEQRWPASWQAGVIDQSNTVIARATDAARYVGQPALDSVKTAISAGTRGPFALLGRDNAALTGTLSAVPGTQWHVITAAPSTALDAQVQAALSPLLWTGLLCTLLSIVGAWFIARALRKQIQQTEADAKAKFATPADAAVVYRVER